MIAKNEFIANTWKGNAFSEVYGPESEQNYMKPVGKTVVQACELKVRTGLVTTVLENNPEVRTAPLRWRKMEIVTHKD
jgi:hypothetical protein